MNIVVLAGGLSPERDVSLSTGTMVTNALRKKGHNAILVDLFFGMDPLPDPIAQAFAVDGMLPPFSVPQDAPDLEQVRACAKQRLLRRDRAAACWSSAARRTLRFSRCMAALAKTGAYSRFSISAA